MRVPPLRLRLHGDCGPWPDTSGACQRGMVLRSEQEPDRCPSARSAPTAQPPGDGPTVVASVADARDVSAIVPQSDGLFVARADTGQRP